MNQVNEAKRARSPLIALGPGKHRKSEISNNAGPVKSFFVFPQIFCHLFAFFEHTTVFTPKSGLVRFVLPLARRPAHDSLKDRMDVGDVHD